MTASRLIFLLIPMLALLGAPLAADAEQPQKVYRIGYLVFVATGPTTAERGVFFQAFLQALHNLGYIEGQNIAIEWRSAEGRPERLPVLAAELIRLSPDVIVAPTNEVLEATKQATRTIPIVTVFVNDPVGRGLIASLARPGGNITGLTFDVSEEMYGKRLELLKDAAPTASRVAVLWNPAFPGAGKQVKAAGDAARKLGLTLQSVELRGLRDLEDVFAAVARQRAEALLVVGDPLIFLGRRQVADLAARHRLPAIYTFRAYVETGGLMSYGPNGYEQFRRAAAYVARILKGARPGELPMEQPTKFEFVINLKTARALGLTIPASVLARADEVIE